MWRKTEYNTHPKKEIFLLNKLLFWPTTTRELATIKAINYLWKPKQKWKKCDKVKIFFVGLKLVLKANHSSISALPFAELQHIQQRQGPML